MLMCRRLSVLRDGPDLGCHADGLTLPCGLSSRIFLLMMLQLRFALAGSALLLMSSCGGGGGGGTGNASGTTVTGVSFKGPTAGATVCAYQIDNAAPGRKGAQVGSCAVTSSDGSYTLTLPAGTSSDLLLESTGGTYCSDESVFSSGACSGGGTPVAMGTAALRTVVTAGGSSVSAPLTLLTTAAINNAGTLSATTFNTAYAGVAATVGVDNTDPAASPSSGTLNTALSNLAAQVGTDATQVATVVQAVASGNAVDFECRALEASDALVGGSDIKQFSSCTEDGTNATVDTYAFGPGTLSDLLGGSTLSGTYTRSIQEGVCGSTTGLDLAGSGSTTMSISYGGVQAVPFGTTVAGSSTQAGSASRFTIDLASSGGFITAQTRKVLFCRQQASFGSQAFSGFLTAGTDTREGYLSRVDTSATFVGAP